MAGSLIKLDEEIVTSATASVTLGGTNWDTAYDVYVVQIINAVPDTDSVRFETRFTVSGSPDTSSNYDRSFLNLRGDSAFSNIANTSQTEIDLGTTGTSTEEMVNVSQYLFQFNNSSSFSFTTVEASIRNNGGHLRGFQGGASLKESQATDGVHYFFSSGNISSGKFKLYGLKKS